MKNQTQMKIGASVIFVIILTTGIFWFQPERQIDQGHVIATLVPGETDLANGDLGVDDRYITGAKIIALDIIDKGKDPVLLTEEFYSARSPELSYDGTRLVFTGRKKEEDPWQIYVKDLQTMQLRKITDSPANCTDPAWLPDGRIVFSRLKKVENTGEWHELIACDPDGSRIKPLTFQPNSSVSASIFQDGRILYVSNPERTRRDGSKLLAMRVDGTMSELFYKNESNIIQSRTARENTDGHVYFIETGRNLPSRMSLVSVVQGYPMSSRENISINEPGNFHSLYPLSSAKLLVSYQPSEDQPFGLYEFDLKARNISDQVYVNEDSHIIEPVMVRERKTPMKLPSRVDERMEKGTLLSHNTDYSSIPVSDKIKGGKKTSKIRVYGPDGMMGEIPVEKDGSFYIEIDADTPVRFQTVNKEGEVLRGPSDWIWVRPNERRSCIGCHEDPELAPENRVPDALYEGMVKLPEGVRTDPVEYTEN